MAQMAMQQHVVEHGEHDKAQQKSWSSSASGFSFRCPDNVLPLDPARSGRESEVDFVRLSLTIIQFTAHVILISNTHSQIAKASATFGLLSGSIWDRNRIRFDTKLKVYRSVVLRTLLYACKIWTVYQWHAKRLNHFHTSCLRKLLKIKWQDRIPDTVVLKRAGMQSVHTLLKLAQLRWTGHVTRMPDEHLPKKILYGELQVGKRSNGGQKK